MSHDPAAYPRTEQDPVALIVPIYNVQDYLDECLESVAAQTVFSELQVVLVDDGSTDASGEIAAAFAERHVNVTLVTQENRGLGGARNRGLQEVDAPLVTFLDSDDRLPPEAIETLRAVLLEHDADVAIGAMMTFPNKTAWPWLRHLDEESKLLEGVEHAEALIHGASVCNKLFRTAMLREMDLSFGERTHFEDVYVSLPVLLAADRIALTRTVVYHYRQRSGGGSIMNSIWSRTDNYFDHLAVEEFLDGRRAGVAGARRIVLDLFLVRSFQGFALRAPDALSPEELTAFFTRAVAVFSRVTPDVIQRACLDARHRIAFVAFCLDDWHLFSDRTSAVCGLEAEEGRLYLQLRERPAQFLRDLLRADRLTAHLESVDPGSGGRVLTVRGRLNIDGMTLLTPLPCELGLRVRGSGLTQPATNECRHVSSVAGTTDTWSGFVCDLPAKKLKTGDHMLRLVFTTPTGQASVHVRPANGVLRAARTLSLGSARALLLKRGNNAVLRVQVGTGARGRWRWRRRQLVDDVQHVRSRAPMWQQRLLRLLTAPFFRSGVWLLGERRDTAQDNSAVLFEHLRRTRPALKAYYLIDADSPHRDRVERLGNVVTHSSRRHRLLMLHAAVLINSYDIDGYMLPRQWKVAPYLQHLAWRIGSRRVFLQHGVIYNNVSAALHRGVTGLDLFVASAEAEAVAIRAGMGYPTQVTRTGLPRFDGLHRGPVGRRVLVMPTWRSQLVRPSYARDRAAAGDFETSQFAAFWRGLLNDGRLLDTLGRTGTTLEFFAHYEMAEVAHTLIPDHEHVVVSHHSTRSVQEAILDSSLFVTDWSSTFFDAAYAGRPIVLTPFDEQEFRATQYAKGYFDLEQDGFGPVARSVDDAVDAIVDVINGGFRREEVYEQRVRDFFPYRDRGQSERVVAAILDVLRGRIPAQSAGPVRTDATAPVPVPEAVA